MEIKQDLLTINPYSRPNKPLKTVKKIVLHWVANPGTTAKQNRNFFERRKETKVVKGKTKGKFGYGSTQYIVDDNEIIQCIPDTEIAYHVGAKEYKKYAYYISPYPNDSTIGIEMCHPDETGIISEKTLSNVEWLVKHLCYEHDLNIQADVCRHYDITGKICPKYYVENEQAFYELLLDWS